MSNDTQASQTAQAIENDLGRELTEQEKLLTQQAERFSNDIVGRAHEMPSDLEVFQSVKANVYKEYGVVEAGPEAKTIGAMTEREIRDRFDPKDSRDLYDERGMVKSNLKGVAGNRKGEDLMRAIRHETFAKYGVQTSGGSSNGS